MSFLSSPSRNPVFQSNAFAGIGANLFFILTVSLLSWYHWSESHLMEETRQRIRSRAEEARRRRSGGRASHDTTDVSSISASNDESFKQFDEDDDEDEDISIISEKLAKMHESDEIEEISDISDVRRRKTPESVDISTGGESVA